MRLAPKFVLAFTLWNILLAALYGYWAVRREVRLFQHTASVEAESLGLAMEDMVADAWRRSGQQGVLRVVRKVNQGQEHELHVRWVWFDARPGDPFFPSVSPERLTTVTIQQHLAVEALDPDRGVGHLLARGAAPSAAAAWTRPRHAAELQNNQREIVQRSAFFLIGGMALLSGLLAAALGMSPGWTTAAGVDGEYPPDFRGKPARADPPRHARRVGGTRRKSEPDVPKATGAVAREDSRRDRHPHRRHGTTPPCRPPEDGRSHGLGDCPRVGHPAERGGRPGGSIGSGSRTADEVAQGPPPSRPRPTR